MSMRCVPPLLGVRLSLLILAVTGLFDPAGMHAQDVAAPNQVFLLIGQSNMAGRAPMIDGDDQPIGNVLLLDADGHWIAATNPLNRFATDRKDLSMQRISPGAGFAPAIAKHLPEARIGIISNARGGTSIQEWEKGRPLYDHTLARIQALKDVTITGVLWHQGEANRDDADYLQRLQVLIETLRKDLGSPNLPFVAGEIYGKAGVNEQLARLAETVPHTGVASAEGLKVFDNVHFDRDSQIVLGQRYAEAMAAILKKQSHE